MIAESHITLSPSFKQNCVEAIKIHSAQYKTDKAHAIAIGISASQYSQLKGGKIDNVISDKAFKLIGNRYNVPIEGDTFYWQTAKTKVFNYIYAQLKICQSINMSGMFCDRADLGKSAVAKYYCNENKNAIYVDCSIYKSRTKMLRAIAREFGIEYNLPLRYLQRDLAQYLNSCFTPPLIVLDEMGDLEYPAFLEIKALWNAAENKCAWYGMGADGLKEKFERQLKLRRVGYSEVFRRFSSKYQSILPVNANDAKLFIIDEIKIILKVNPSKLTPLQMYAKSGGSLTRVYNLIKMERLGIIDYKKENSKKGKHV